MLVALCKSCSYESNYELRVLPNPYLSVTGPMHFHLQPLVPQVDPRSLCKRLDETRKKSPDSGIRG
jgi:hypothetical protein